MTFQPALRYEAHPFIIIYFTCYMFLQEKLK